MNKKFKSLKNRILLLTFTIILFTAITVGLSIFYQYTANNLKSLILTIKNIEKEVIQLENTEQDLILNFNKVSVFFTSDNTRFENEFRTSINHIKKRVDSFSELSIIQNNISNNKCGIFLSWSTNNSVERNLITNNSNAVYFFSVHLSNMESNNIYSHEGSGIHFVTSRYNKINAIMLAITCNKLVMSRNKT